MKEKMYRNIALIELGQIIRTGKVFPKPFQCNRDSDCLHDSASFWFAEPIKLVYADSVVESAYSPDDKGFMGWDMADTAHDIMAESEFFATEELYCLSERDVDVIYVPESMLEVDKERLLWACVGCKKVFSDNWEDQQWDEKNANKVFFDGFTDETDLKICPSCQKKNNIKPMNSRNWDSIGEHSKAVLH